MVTSCTFAYIEPKGLCPLYLQKTSIAQHAFMAYLGAFTTKPIYFMRHLCVTLKPYTGDRGQGANLVNLCKNQLWYIPRQDHKYPNSNLLPAINRIHPRRCLHLWQSNARLTPVFVHILKAMPSHRRAYSEQNTDME